MILDNVHILGHCGNPHKMRLLCLCGGRGVVREPFMLLFCPWDVLLLYTSGCLRRAHKDLADSSYRIGKDMLLLRCGHTLLLSLLPSYHRRLAWRERFSHAFWLSLCNSDLWRAHLFAHPVVTSQSTHTSILCCFQLHCDESRILLPVATVTVLTASGTQCSLFLSMARGGIPRFKQFNKPTYAWAQ
jgi:hypothetical protein